MNHTKGPWSYGSVTNEGVVIWSGDYEVLVGIAKIVDVSPGEMLANARLIAAAPDLLAACEEALLLVVRTAAYENLKSAIAKAKGEKP